MLLVLIAIVLLHGFGLGCSMLNTMFSDRRRLPMLLAAALLTGGLAQAAVEDAVVMVEGCSGVCVDPGGLVLTAKHCNLPASVTIRFKDRTVSATRIYTCPESEGPVVYDCEGDGYPYIPVAASPPQQGERVWSYGFPARNGRRELRWASGPVLRWSSFEYAGGAFNGNIVGFVTGPGWSGGPLLNAKGEVCGLLNSSDCATSVFISSAAVRQAYSAARQQREREQPAGDDRPKLYVFGSVTCGPCRQFKEDFSNNAALRQQLQSRFTVEFVDADQQVDLASRFGVTEVPTFIVPDVVRVTGYQGPDDLLTRLAIKQEIAARPPPPNPTAPADEAPAPQPPESAPTAPVNPPVAPPVSESPAPADPSDPDIAASPEAADRLDRLSALVQSAVSVATWLGVGGMTGGAGGMILGGLALWRTVRRRRDPKPARDPPPPPPPVVTLDSPPPPQAIVPETRFAPYERDTFAQAFAWAETELVRKYPGAVSTLETLKGLINQFLAAKGITPPK